MGLTREQAVVALYKHNNNVDKCVCKLFGKSELTLSCSAVNWLLENASVDWSAQKQPPLKPTAAVATAVRQSHHCD